MRHGGRLIIGPESTLRAHESPAAAPGWPALPAEHGRPVCNSTKVPTASRSLGSARTLSDVTVHRRIAASNPAKPWQVKAAAETCAPAAAHEDMRTDVRAVRVVCSIRIACSSDGGYSERGTTLSVHTAAPPASRRPHRAVVSRLRRSGTCPAQRARTPARVPAAPPWTVPTPKPSPYRPVAGVHAVRAHEQLRFSARGMPWQR